MPHLVIKPGALRSFKLLLLILLRWTYVPPVRTTTVRIHFWDMRSPARIQTHGNRRHKEGTRQRCFSSEEFFGVVFPRGQPAGSARYQASTSRAALEERASGPALQADGPHAPHWLLVEPVGADPSGWQRRSKPRTLSSIHSYQVPHRSWTQAEANLEWLQSYYRRTGPRSHDPLDILEYITSYSVHTTCK